MSGWGAKLPKTCKAHSTIKLNLTETWLQPPPIIFTLIAPMMTIYLPIITDNIHL